ncbi:hypothetical protein GJ496_000755 [Pomphorhynchus laevis]|nr:hypothetical protein GJ496_000755 [Pomphorhynchus laevis]
MLPVINVPNTSNATIEITFLTIFEVIKWTPNALSLPQCDDSMEFINILAELFDLACTPNDHGQIFKKMLNFVNREKRLVLGVL